MSLAVFTDSTTAQASPAFTFRPTAGNSTKTTSVNSCWAWSVMPIVANPSLTRTHSCDFAYFKSEGMFDIKRLSQGDRNWSTRFLVKGLGNNHRRGAITSDFDFELRLRFRELR